MATAFTKLSLDAGVYAAQRGSDSAKRFRLLAHDTALARANKDCVDARGIVSAPARWCFQHLSQVLTFG